MIGAKAQSLAEAILLTVAYSDIFDYPVTLAEIHRNLIGRQATPDEVEAAVRDELVRDRQLETSHDHFFLPGRGKLVDHRRRRAPVARRLWPQAIRYGQWIAHLPYVRMVAVTGALTSSNVDDCADLDYLIITAPGHLWTCRAFILLLTLITAPFGARICPNYLLANNALGLPERDLFAAEEFARMALITGAEVWNTFRARNGWIDDYLPNAVEYSAEDSYEPTFKPLQAVGEFLLSSRAGIALENWEMKRKIAKLSKQATIASEAYFTADCCKGHLNGHGARIMQAFSNRAADIREQLIKNGARQGRATRRSSGR